MRCCVVAQRMPLLKNCADQVRVCVNLFANDKKGGARIMPPEQIQDFSRVCRVWAVIDRQPNFLLIGPEISSDESKPITVRAES